MLLPGLEQNLSFVLHERSNSDAVRRTALAARRHASRTRMGSQVTHSTAICDGDRFSADHWLTASLGLPRDLPDVLFRDATNSPLLVPIDGDGPLRSQHTLFRAPADLALGSDLVPSGLIGVAALVARPGGHQAQLIVHGPFRLPEDFPVALRHVEALIQSYADQWMPERLLWSAPAEVLLGDEIR